MKKCNKCSLEKPLSEFHKRVYKNGTESVQPTCKACKKAVCAKRYSEKKDEIKESNKRWSEKNLEKHNELRKSWRQANRPLLAHYTAEYRASKKQATPPWLTEFHIQQIKRMYHTCPDGYHVDHIIPLNGETVCGLHVPWNLQHLPARENIVKSNKLLG